MDVKTGLFYLFAAVLLFAAFRVITARNPVHAALYLVLAFFQAAAVWMLLKAEFLAITLVLVYVGAVMVLFLFVVMMLDINMDSVRQGFWKHFPLAATVGALIALEMAAVLMGGFRIADEPKGRCRGAGGRQAVELPWSWASCCTHSTVPAGDRGRDPAGGHDRRHRADPARAQGQQTHGPGAAGARACERPFARW
jgi:NADH:ubiquinone oxidoreductase subunit 6 (subunit J)